MAMRSGFFDSTEVVETVGGFPRGNKAETADFFAAYFASFVGNGVHINPPDSFKVSPVSGLTVRIAPGRCFINGYFGWDSEPEEHTFEPDVVAHSYWLVLRLDLDGGSIKKVWLTDPAPGELPVREGDIYDLVVARVDVGAGVSAITEMMITDYRDNAELCGRVKSLVDGIGQNVAYADVAGTLAEGAMAQLVQRAGSIMTGPLTLHGDPASPLHAATKQYVDSRAPRLVELVRFTSSGTFNPADYPSAGNRYLIMILGAGGGSYKSDSSTDYFASGGAGAMQFIDLYLPPNSPVTSFPVVIGAASLDSDGGTTSFWCWQAPGGKKATSYAQYGQGGQAGSFTGERGTGDYGGNTLYGRGASSSSSAGRGGGSWRDKVGGDGLCVIYGYVE